MIDEIYKIVEKYNEPQIKAPRVTPLEGVYTYCFAIRGRGVENPQGFGIDERRYFPVTDFIKTTHRKGRKERKAAQQESLRPLRPPWLNTSSAPAHERAPPQPAPAVHLRSSRAGG